MSLTHRTDKYTKRNESSDVGYFERSFVRVTEHFAECRQPHDVAEGVAQNWAYDATRCGKQVGRNASKEGRVTELSSNDGKWRAFDGMVQMCLRANEWVSDKSNSLPVV